MRRWEQRLADLAHLLVVCGSTYFEPNLFRLNTNQFLTTARTVTFLIQKEKESIPNFSQWYIDNVLSPWSSDDLMTWAKDSRNHIEKEGDLDLHSELAVVLIFSYDEEQDLVVPCARAELVSANIKRLIRFAEKRLPSGVADAAVLKIERRWVANSLPTQELLNALSRVYSRIHTVVEALTKHLELQANAKIPDPVSLDARISADRHIRYVKFRHRQSASYVTKRVERDPNYQPPPWLAALAERSDRETRCQTLSGRVQYFAEMAKGTFEQFGNHVPMLWLFDRNGNTVDYIGLVPDDQATKFILWRRVADRITLLRAWSLVWICEVWIRDMRRRYELPIRMMPIKGELLQVVGVDATGSAISIEWNIVRASANARPTLSLRDESADGSDSNAYFLAPARRAFEQVHQWAARREV